MKNILFIAVVFVLMSCFIDEENDTSKSTESEAKWNQTSSSLVLSSSSIEVFLKERSSSKKESSSSEKARSSSEKETKIPESSDDQGLISSSSIIEIEEAVVDTFACVFNSTACRGEFGTHWIAGDLAENYLSQCDSNTMADLMRYLPKSKITVTGLWNSNGNSEGYDAGEDSVVIDEVAKRIIMYHTEYLSYDVSYFTQSVCLVSGKYEDYVLGTHTTLRQRENVY